MNDTELIAAALHTHARRLNLEAASRSYGGEHNARYRARMRELSRRAEALADSIDRGKARVTVQASY